MHWIRSYIARAFPEKHVFIKSDDGTRFLRLKPQTQFWGWLGSSAMVGWTIIVSAILVIDNLGAGTLREQAEREQALYELRLNEIAAERDRQILLAAAAQDRFSVALDQISMMQTKLLESGAQNRELATGIDLIQATLRTAIDTRDVALREIDVLKAEADRATNDVRAELDEVDDLRETVTFLSNALTDFADIRANSNARAAETLIYAEQLQRDIELMEERNDRIFRQLEDAVSNSLEPLGKMFATVKLPTDRIVEELRRTYNGQGGPLTPIAFSTQGLEVDADTIRANALLLRFDELSLHQIAASQTPFVSPVAAAVRYTSGFGYRRDPINGGRKLHKGSDWAGAYGTPILATADGTVISAGWAGGYGRLIKIRHANGFETRYAHLAKIRVKSGQKVSRGQHIGDMGSSGRSTGTHLHYEVRRNGEAVNPMTYIKAARDVF